MDWWKLDSESSNGTPQVLTTERMFDLGNKMMAFMSLLAMSVNAGDKMILFSQSRHTLAFIEMCLNMPNWSALVDVDSKIRGISFSKWRKYREYCIITGKTGVEERQRLINKFNATDSMKLFLISTRAGNMGINLTSANRVVIFDISWNPAQDLHPTK